MSNEFPMRPRVALVFHHNTQLRIQGRKDFQRLAGSLASSGLREGVCHVPWYSHRFSFCFLRADVSVWAYLTYHASHPPPASCTYAYNTFKPGAPGIPSVGQSYVDPVFGSTITRLTNVGGANFGDSYLYVKN